MNATRFSALAVLAVCAACANATDSVGPSVTGVDDAVRIAGGIGVVDLGTLGGKNSHALGLNTPSAGQPLLVVGDAQNPAGQTVASYWHYNVASGVASAGVPLTTDGDMQSTAYGANESEQIVGGSYTTFTTGGVTTYPSRAVRWTTTSGAAGTLLDGLGGTYTTASAINTLGEIVGESISGIDGKMRPVLWKPASGVTATDLGFFAGVDVQAQDRNASGTIVGAVRSTPYTLQTAFVWRSIDGVETFEPLPDLGPPPAGDGIVSYATAVNDAGVIVGFVNTASFGVRAVRWNLVAGKYVVENLLLGTGSQANDINNYGEIVGTHRATRSNGGFYLFGSILKELPALSSSARPFRINGNGDVVGFSTFRNGYTHAVVWTHVRTP
jgi:probable HAF family extracellular repeat protein